MFKFDTNSYAMKNFYRLFPLLLVFICLSMAGYALAPGKYVFMDDHSVIAPHIDYSVILISLDENAGTRDLQEFENSFPVLQPVHNQSYPWRNMRLYSLPPAYYLSEDAAEAYLSDIRAHHLVLAAYPAFVRDGETAYLDNLLLLNLQAESIADGTLDRLLQPYQAVVVEELDMIRSVTIAVSVPAEVNIFEVCMELAKSDAVAFAQPNFHFRAGRLSSPTTLFFRHNGSSTRPVMPTSTPRRPGTSPPDRVVLRLR